MNISLKTTAVGGLDGRYKNKNPRSALTGGGFGIGFYCFELTFF
jgi:hypothetical protein